MGVILFRRATDSLTDREYSFAVQYVGVDRWMVNPIPRRPSGLEEIKEGIVSLSGQWAGAKTEAVSSSGSEKTENLFVSTVPVLH